MARGKRDLATDDLKRLRDDVFALFNTLTKDPKKEARKQRAWGMLFGAYFIQFAPGWGEDLAKHVHYNEATTQSTVFYGAILLLVLFVMPGGAAQLVRQLGGGLKRLREWIYSRADSRAAA